MTSIRDDTLLAVRGLQTYFHRKGRFVRAVDDVSFDVPRKGRVGLLGESGSGKTQTALSLLGLVAGAPGIVGGDIWLDGQNLLKDLEAHVRIRSHRGVLRVEQRSGSWNRRLAKRFSRIRGTTVAMVFQEPRGALSPYFSVREHLRETLRARSGREDARHVEDRVRPLLERLRFANTERVLNAFPHELSGGECQRVMLALALIGKPALLIADEPTTLLDASTQSDVLDVLGELLEESSQSLLLISHDLALLDLFVDHLVVMYRGHVVEAGPTAHVLDGAGDTRHPYTDALLRTASGTLAGVRDEPNAGSAGRGALRGGCPYYERCPLRERFSGHARARCQHERPPLIQQEGQHRIACWAMEGRTA